MPGDLTRLAEIIDQLALQTILVEPDDMITLGSLLEQLEGVEKGGSETGLDPVTRLARALKIMVEKIILNEVTDPRAALELLGKGVQAVQARVAHPDLSTSPPGEEEVWESLKPLTGMEGPSLLPAGAGAAGQESFALTQDLDLYRDFIPEAMEHLEAIELNIINLEQSPGDKECINAIFRPFHTIKGVAGFLNLPWVNKFAHAMESLLDDARSDRLRISQPIIDFILEAVDVLKGMIQALKPQIETGEIRPYAFNFDAFLVRLEALQTGTAPLAASPEEPEGKKPPLGEILSSQGVVSKTDIQEALALQKEDSRLRLGEILIRENKAKPKQVVEALREQKRVATADVEATVKVDTGKLDNLVDMVGELVIAQSLVQQNPVFASLHDQKLARDFSQLKRITTDLQKISMSLRMVPIRQTFQKMIRLVRDLANKSGKKVDLVMSGEETEIDRNMVDALYEPLVHMIRNAVDHGIEMPSKRMERGKPETGRIFLRAYQKGGHVVIEIEDEGQGLNRTRIVQKAKEKGLISEEMVLTEYQIDNLIFEAGFSTAEKVTDVSGRGVGMDVVKKTIERLRGKVEIFSFDGKGTRFIMRVPLTLAIMDGILVMIGEERYIIPMVFIKETVRPRQEDVSTVQTRGDLLKVRENLFPLVRLHQLLGVTPRKAQPWEALVVVVENEGVQKGLMVDDLLGKQEVVIKTLGEKLKTVKGVGGATIMGDGRVGLILDIPGIFDIFHNG
jgi:two-component system, chemotaxis family, sensor kinase CheA